MTFFVTSVFDTFSRYFIHISCNLDMYLLFSIIKIHYLIHFECIKVYCCIKVYSPLSVLKCIWYTFEWIKTRCPILIGSNVYQSLARAEIRHEAAITNSHSCPQTASLDRFTTIYWVIMTAIGRSAFPENIPLDFRFE